MILRRIIAMMCVTLLMASAAACGQSADPAAAPGKETVLQAEGRGETAVTEAEEMTGAVEGFVPRDRLPKGTWLGTYRGIRDYGKVTAEQVMAADFDGYLFEREGEILELSMAVDDRFSLQNLLEEGQDYAVAVKGNRVEALVKCGYSEPTPQTVISGTPGERTLKNLLATALSPIGHVLYVYGGGWNWQDEGSAPQAVSLGVQAEWDDFYQAHAGDYNYRFVPGTENKVEDHSGTYPFGAWNQYYYAGLDCSGYMGWLVYNVMTTREEDRTGTSRGYVGSSSRFARRMAEEFDLGTYTTEWKGQLRPGDIVSIHGHVWMCVGTCEDGSIVLVHSSATPDRKGEMSGGVQLSVIDPEGRGEDCEAYRLVEETAKAHFPEWLETFGITVREYSDYLNFQDDENTGVFTWYSGEEGLADPEGYAGMTAREILTDLFARKYR